jgi:excisionase family DNA binding protein
MNARSEAGIAPAAMGVREACRYIGLGKSTLYELLKAGRIEGVKCGSRRLIFKASLDAFLASLLNKKKKGG